MNSLSIVIPIFNEGKRLSQTFSEIISFIEKKIFSQLEIIFVDDGSTDISKNLIFEFIKTTKNKYPLIHLNIISYPRNQGKGYAVAQGMKCSQGNYILMVDADMSTPLLEIEKFIPSMNQGISVIIGTRKGSSAVLVKRQPWYRESMGEGYAFLARLFTGLTMRDFGCGFKVFSFEAAQRIFPQIVTKGWIFDTEALFLAKKFNYTIEEVGITWRDDPQTRVHIFSDMFKCLFDLVFMRFKHR